jgi:hypothetical protein
LSNLGTLSVGINVMSQRAPNKVATLHTYRIP